MKLILLQRLYEEIKAHALQELPRECCGIVATDTIDDDIHVGVRAFRTANVSADPKTGYRVDPEDQLWVTEEARHADLRVGVVYHSHPNDSAYPSRGDSQLAYPAIHLIVGLGGQLSMCAWRFDLGLAHQVELKIA